MLMIVMVGIAASMLGGTQVELNVSGVSREQALALNAAEYAVAQAKALIAAQVPAAYNATTGWTPLLTSSVPAVQNILCNPMSVNASVPGTLPKAANGVTNLFLDASGMAIVDAPIVQWRYCIHNNAEDPHYLDPANNVGGVPNGDVDDQRDANHLLVIEASGEAPNGAVANVTVTIGAPSFGTLATPPGDSYSQEGGGAEHGGGGGANEKGIAVRSGTVTF